VSPVVPRKLIIDCDPGIDDAVALAIALFDPRVEVLAVTAVAGNVPAEQATANAQAIVSFLDPPRSHSCHRGRPAFTGPTAWVASSCPACRCTAATPRRR
jgi:purine nucleosidase